MARFIDESPEYQPEDGEALANLEDEETQIPEEEQPAEPEEIQEAQEESKGKEDCATETEATADSYSSDRYAWFKKANEEEEDDET